MSERSKGHDFWGFGVFLLFLIVDLGECVTVTVNLTSIQIQTVLDVHNGYRAQEGGSDMYWMTWSDELAQKAQEYAELCLFEHGMTKWDNSTYTAVGQNLYYSTANYPISHAMMKWYIEKADYDYDTRGCAPGKICGHYTQLVWSTSKVIGCGWAFCPEIEVAPATATTPRITAKNAYYFACNYGPQGNIGKLPPFTKGNKCTRCSSNAYWCYQDLCRDDCTEGTDGCSCNAACENCGTVDQTTCTCSCVAGKHGAYCQKNCTDTNDWCGTSWPPFTCKHATWGAQITEECPSMCGSCETWTAENEKLATACVTTTTTRSETTKSQQAVEVTTESQAAAAETTEATSEATTQATSEATTEVPTTTAETTVQLPTTTTPPPETTAAETTEGTTAATTETTTAASTATTTAATTTSTSTTATTTATTVNCSWRPCGPAHRWSVSDCRCVCRQGTYGPNCAWRCPPCFDSDPGYCAQNAWRCNSLNIVSPQLCRFTCKRCHLPSVCQGSTHISPPPVQPGSSQIGPSPGQPGSRPGNPSNPQPQSGSPWQPAPQPWQPMREFNPHDDEAWDPWDGIHTDNQENTKPWQHDENEENWDPWENVNVEKEENSNSWQQENEENWDPWQHVNNNAPNRGNQGSNRQEEEEENWDPWEEVHQQNAQDKEENWDPWEQVWANHNG